MHNCKQGRTWTRDLLYPAKSACSGDRRTRRSPPAGDRSNNSYREILRPAKNGGGIPGNILQSTHKVFTKKNPYFNIEIIHGHGGGGAKGGGYPPLKAKVRVPLPARLLFSTCSGEFFWDISKNPPKIAQNYLKTCKISWPPKSSIFEPILPKVLPPPLEPKFTPPFPAGLISTPLLPATTLPKYDRNVMISATEPTKVRKKACSCLVFGSARYPPRCWQYLLDTDF